MEFSLRLQEVIEQSEQSKCIPKCIGVIINFKHANTQYVRSLDNFTATYVFRSPNCWRLCILSQLHVFHSSTIVHTAGAHLHFQLTHLHALFKTSHIDQGSRGSLSYFLPFEMVDTSSISTKVGRCWSAVYLVSACIFINSMSRVAVLIILWLRINITMRTTVEVTATATPQPASKRKPRDPVKIKDTLY